MLLEILAANLNLEYEKTTNILYYGNNKENKILISSISDDSNTHHTQYLFDLSNFSGELNIVDSRHNPLSIGKPVKMKVQNGLINIKDYDNSAIYDFVDPPILFLNGDGKKYRIYGSLNEIINDISISSDNITLQNEMLYPLASMGKMYTACMLIKAFENLEQSMPTKIRDKILQDHSAETLMDVPLTTIQLINEIQNKNLLNQGIEWLQKIPNGKDRIHIITPRMLLNHSAGIPEWWRFSAFNSNEILSQATLSTDNTKGTFDILNANAVLNCRTTEPFLNSENLTYSNGNTVFAGVMIEAITGESIQENLSKISSSAIIYSTTDSLKSKEFAKIDSIRSMNGKPIDLGYTAGGIFDKTSAVVDFTQKYLSGEFFDTEKYKEYMAYSIKTAKSHGKVHSHNYENSLLIYELNSSQHGFTHSIGHTGNTPQIKNECSTLVKCNDHGKIIQVGKTNLYMNTMSTTRYEQKIQSEQKAVKKIQNFWRNKVQYKRDIALSV